MATQSHRTLNVHHAGSVTSEVIEAGAVAGLAGGVAMALFATTYAAATGLGFWTPVSAIAATVLGTAVFDVGVGAVLVGLAIHLFVSVAIGILFAFCAPRALPPAPALALGTFVGVLILVVMTFVVLPLVSPSVRAQLMWGSAPHAIPVVIAFVMHLIYGAGLALAPSLRRQFTAA
jgi:hypothetical protein